MEFVLRPFQGNDDVRCQLSYKDGLLRLAYAVDSPGQIRWPAASGLQRADELWRTTCFELFIGNPENEQYLEINLAPSGGWNCYAFDSYRAAMRENQAVSVHAFEAHEPVLVAEIRLALSEKIYLGPSAIIAQGDGSIGYYALCHGEQPDFHDRSQHVLVETNRL